MSDNGEKRSEYSYKVEELQRSECVPGCYRIACNCGIHYEKQAGEVFFPGLNL